MGLQTRAAGSGGGTAARLGPHRMLEGARCNRRTCKAGVGQVRSSVFRNRPLSVSELSIWKVVTTQVLFLVRHVSATPCGVPVISLIHPCFPELPPSVPSEEID